MCSCSQLVNDTDSKISKLMAEDILIDFIINAFSEKCNYLKISYLNPR